MTPAHLLLESPRWQVGFGTAFVDAATGERVADGLRVRVWRLVGAQAVEPVMANAGRSGTFAAFGLPGLRAFEAGGAAPPPRDFLVEVRDALSRYHPFVMRVALPQARTVALALPGCGAALWPQASASPPMPPPVSPPGVPLFALPGRPVPLGQATLRATLLDAAGSAAVPGAPGAPATPATPAAGAVLEVRLGSPAGPLLGRGVADARGELLLSFPWPEPADPPPIVSPGAPVLPLAPETRSWPLALAVRWQRDLPLHRPDAALTPLPDLCALLAQPPAAMSCGDSPRTPLSAALLRQGVPLVLAADAGARVFVDPT